MRIDLCRMCGSEMREHHKCEDCRKPISFVCYRCKNVTDIQYHSSCEDGLLILH